MPRALALAVGLLALVPEAVQASVLYGVCYNMLPNGQCASQEQTYDLYLPDTLQPAPLVVLVHGGGWWGGDKATDAPPQQAKRLRKLGYAAASIDYRLSVDARVPVSYNRMPDQADDVALAIAHLRSQAGSYGIDPQRVFLWGISAGGHLVSFAGLERSLGLRGVVDLFGPTALGRRESPTVLAWDDDLAQQQITPVGDPHRCPPFSAINPVHGPWVGQSHPWSMLSELAGCPAADDPCQQALDDASVDLPPSWSNPPPPFLILHHWYDCTVPFRQSQRLAQALESAQKGTADLRFHPGNHYYTRPDLDGDDYDSKAIDPFLERHANDRLAGVADFNADQRADLLWQDPTTGRLVIWLMNGPVRVGTLAPTPDAWDARPFDLAQEVVAVADLDGDGAADLLWRHRGTGTLTWWRMSGGTRASSTVLSPAAPADPQWAFQGSGDFDGDFKADLLWRHAVSGKLVLWFMNAATRKTADFTEPDGWSDLDWEVRGLAAMTHHAAPDILWRHRVTGEMRVWSMEGRTRVGDLTPSPASQPDPLWQPLGSGHLAASVDESADWLWRHSRSNRLEVWSYSNIDRTGVASTEPASAPPTLP